MRYIYIYIYIYTFIHTILSIISPGGAVSSWPATAFAVAFALCLLGNFSSQDMYIYIYIYIYIYT